MKQPRCHKLFPPRPTPADESCSCTGSLPTKLMSTLGYNPVHCMKCNLEVPPERMKFDEPTIESIAHWNSLYRSVYTLWLDSQDYEAWAQSQLAEIGSRINTLGRDIAKAISKEATCFYWAFWDESLSKDAPNSCPICRRKWERSPYRANELVCLGCGLACAGDGIDS